MPAPQGWTTDKTIAKYQLILDDKTFTGSIQSKDIWFNTDLNNIHGCTGVKWLGFNYHTTQAQEW